ncbi:cyclin-dependent kinase 12-like [Thrips palmi]|uniref:Cyclin-dependent kinase 12-like n=1 Tax=Thrips palmi TaxID=161013 RepID=A0A6P8Z1D3_THRPL|nr:cyclin-dependent kinase 12-like [Thrips palmi]XP_034240395.1 cyclin-dependent kinase 12-like [Thrips palmi]
MPQDEMDPRDSDIVFLEEVNCSKSEGNAGNAIQSNGNPLKDEIISSCNGDDIHEDVPDFDDLEVLDCWEEVEESNEETEDIEPSKEKREEPVQKKGSEVNPPISKKTEEPSKTSKADKAATVNKLTSPENPKTASYNSLKATEPDVEKASDKKVKDSANNASVKCSSNKTKDGEKVNVKNVHQESKKNSSPTFTSNAHQSSAIEPDKSSSRSHESSKDKQTSQKKSNDKDLCRSSPNLPKDPTETKVDRFLKEMALQHPHIVSLNETPHDEKLLDAISSDSSKHSSIVSPPGVDPFDLPPGVDMDQVAQDTGTSLLLNAIRQSQTQPGRGNQEEYRQLPKEGADSSKVISRVKEGRSRSPYSKNHHKSKMERAVGSPVSSRESFSLSPTPSPRSRRLSPSSVQYPRVPPTFNYMVSNMDPGYSERPYPPPLIERNRYHRSPVRDPRDLSRSLSRERSRHRSRSRSWSRGRTFVRRRSRSRHRYSSKEEHFRRYRRSSSNTRSPTRRMRSRSRSQSRSQSRHQYRNKRSPLWDDEQRSKRPRLSRSISRSRSPWKSHAESLSNEWHTNYSDGNRNTLVDEEVKLEHDMARFIATNIAATGLRPPVSNVTGWFETEVKPHDKPSNSQAIPGPPPDIIDHGMPLPPPPPDISELMTPEEIKETKSQREMSPVPAVSLSSLLESAVTGFPEKVILDRCQDAIMKLHDVSIKPGRFAVISTIKVPQANPSSTFQPWQSVLNRSLASKIHFTYSKLPEQPVYWKPKPIPIRTASLPGKEALPGSSSHSLKIPVPSTVDMDRSALLEKIFLLTRELQEVRRVLDSRCTTKKHVAVQACFVNYCDSCGIEIESMLADEGQPQQEGSSFGASCFQPNSSLVHEPTRQPVMEYDSSWHQVPLPVPAPQPVRQPQPVPASEPVRQPPPVPTLQSLRPSQPVPAPLLVPPPPQMAPNSDLKQSNPQTSGLLISNPSGSSLLGPPPTVGPSQTVNWCLTEQPGPSSGVGGAMSLQSHVPFSTTGLQSETNQLVNQTEPIPALMSLEGGAKKMTKNKTEPAQTAAPLPPTLKPKVKIMAPEDYDVTKYQMVGDEHMFDLISYLCSVGKQINYNPKFVAHGLSIDNLLKNVIGAGQKQAPVILFFGMYDGNYNAKTLCKFKQLVGFLKNRCSHLVLIEPPPIPRYASKCRPAWNSFNTLEQDYSPFKSENVSLVRTMSFLLSNSGAPNRALFAGAQRVGTDGLKLIAEELEKVILAAKNRQNQSS